MPRSLTSGAVRLIASGGLAFMLFGTTACSVVGSMERNHGYMPEKNAFEDVKVGQDTKASLIQKLGSPSTKGTFDPNVWYYISHKEERFAFFNPDTVQRDILEVRFGQDGKVAALQRYDVDDGQRVAYVGRETPTRGKELSFWEQMFGNVGRGLPGGVGGQAPNPTGGSSNRR